MILDASILPALDILVLERREGPWFVPRGALPAWCEWLDEGTIRVGVPFIASDVFPFFALFISDAEATWAGEGPSRLDSGGFTQIVDGGRELHLAATALFVQGSALLVVAESERIFREERTMLQRARELRLAHDALSREVEQKEVLAHCIVHDLRNPLGSILGALVLLEKQPLEKADSKLVEVALRAANRQDELIREILGVFAAEHDVSSNPLDAPHADVCSVVMQIASVMAPKARARRVDLVPHLRVVHGPVHVRGDELRLFRVVGNLVQNALQYSPHDGAVRLTVHLDADAPTFIRVDVEDDGAGVPPALLPHLFRKFARAGDGTPGTGLGLYFCRITVERWGGAIGYEPRPEGGSRFWFRLPKWSPRTT
ncbi:sensor histidine kinase [Pendulispora albinea]|uniref:histidine kinase n=1 Tax=Pendulispora albinea TaxID=2741071 RepID=A0ABZ2M5B8_9BACT